MFKAGLILFLRVEIAPVVLLIEKTCQRKKETNLWKILRFFYDFNATDKNCFQKKKICFPKWFFVNN